MPSASRQEIRALDRFAIETLGVPGVVLMENAGRCCTDAIEEFLGAAAGKRVGIVAGAGNNGGDGYVIARHLALRGAEAVTFLVTDPAKISGDAEINLNVLRELGLPIRHVAPDDLARLGETLGAFDLVVDAVGGTGIRGELRGPLGTVAEQINRAGKPVIAVDIPTGLDCDTGPTGGPVVRAAMTVTFVARKKGFDAEGAQAFTGEVRVVDIGIPADRVARIAAERARGGDS